MILKSKPAYYLGSESLVTDRHRYISSFRKLNVRKENITTLLLRITSAKANQTKCGYTLFTFVL